MSEESRMIMQARKGDEAAMEAFPGSLLNQFSMDEHEGYFRIATTSRQDILTLKYTFTLEAAKL